MKCWKCDGKGGYEQVDFGDDSGNTSWDICPYCNGAGKEIKEPDYDYKYQKKQSL